MLVARINGETINDEEESSRGCPSNPAGSPSSRKSNSSCAKPRQRPFLSLGSNPTLGMHQRPCRAPRPPKVKPQFFGLSRNGRPISVAQPVEFVGKFPGPRIPKIRTHCGHETSARHECQPYLSDFIGAGCRSRTRDLLITNQLLYRLS